MRASGLLKLTWKDYLTVSWLWRPTLSFFHGTQSIWKTYLKVYDNQCYPAQFNAFPKNIRHWLRTRKALELKPFQAVRSLPQASNLNWTQPSEYEAIPTRRIIEMGSRYSVSPVEFMVCRSLPLKFHKALHILRNSFITTLSSKKLI